ncbi:MAG TPA: PA-phosphatase, partial [Desulfovibrio sp.]|nr:PA-phosphatase [Desulfovibrio sp.]
WHHPSDVFFGWLLGSVAGLAIHLLAHRDSHA